MDGVVCVVDAVFGKQVRVHSDWVSFMNIICDISKWKTIIHKKASAKVSG